MVMRRRAEFSMMRCDGVKWVNPDLFSSCIRPAPPALLFIVHSFEKGTHAYPEFYGPISRIPT